jgi:hypothetical protein
MLDADVGGLLDCCCASTGLPVVEQDRLTTLISMLLFSFAILQFCDELFASGLCWNASVMIDLLAVRVDDRPM